MKETVMTRELLTKAKAHEWLYSFLREGDPCTKTLRDHGVLYADISWSAKVALDALRTDIQAMTVELVKDKGPEFWYEVFGDGRSRCPWAIEGQCDHYHPNRGDECGYLYLWGGWDDPYLCLRTKLAEETHPDLVTLPPEHRGLKATEPSATADAEEDARRIRDHKGPCSQCGDAIPQDQAEFGMIDDDDQPRVFCNALCLGAWNMDHGLLPWGEVPALDAEGLRCQALTILSNTLKLDDTDQNIILCNDLVRMLSPIFRAMHLAEAKGNDL